MGLLDLIFGGGTSQPTAPVQPQAPQFPMPQVYDPNSWSAYLGGALQGGRPGSLSNFVGGFINPAPRLSTAEQLHAAQNANKLGDFDVAAYQRMQQLTGGAPVTRPGLLGSGIADQPAPAPVPAPPAAPAGGSFGLDDGVSGVGAGYRVPSGVFGNAPLGAPAVGQGLLAAPQPVAAGGLLNMPPVRAGGGLLGGAGGATAAPPPLFGVTNMMDQYRIAASSPKMAPIAGQLLTAIQHGVPEGAYLGADGGIYARPGYNEYEAGKSYATGFGTSQGQLPADLTKIGYQGQVDVAKAFPIASAQARAAFPYDVEKTNLQQQGAARFTFQDVRDPVTGQTFQVPTVDAYRMSGQPPGAPAAAPAPRLGYTGIDPRIGATGMLRPDAIALPPPAAAPPAPGMPMPGTVGAGAPPPMRGLPGKLELTPEQQAASAGLGDIDKQITSQGTKADEVLGRLAVVDNAAKDFRTGATGEARLGALRVIQDGLGVFGIKVPDLQRKVAAGETIDKESGYLAAEMTRALGSREAASVFNQVRSIQPGLKLSEGGLDVITNSIRWGTIRDKDLMNYRDQWLANPANGGSIRGMQQAFDRQYPIEMYASRVLPYPLPADATKAIPGVVYRNGQGKSGVWDGRQFQPLN